MFRVECTNCKAAYQVDERRVPAKGLTMKCPKCRESFLVSPPDKPVVPVVKPALSAPNNFGGTMIGVAGKRDLFTGSGRGGDPNNQTQIGIPGPRAVQGNDATMIGVAPSGPSSNVSDLPAVRATGAQSVPAPSKTGRTQDLPVSTPPGPVSHKPNTQDTAVELPALKGAAPAGSAFSSVTPKKASRINFSSGALHTKADAAAKSEGSAKSAPTSQPSAVSSPKGASALAPGARMEPTQAELPAVAVHRTVDVDADLPLVFNPPSASATSRLHKPTSPELPSARSAAQSQPDDAEPFELDLPAVFSGTPKSQSAPSAPKDAPLAISVAPAPAAIAVPLTARVSEEVVDLDSEGVALESLAPSNPPSKEEPSDLDLPDVLGGPALPALPGLDDAGLGFGELDLPTVGSSRGSADLPPLPEFGSKLPSFAPSEPPLGRVSSQPPSFRARQDSFGDFDGVPSFAPSTANPAVTSGDEDAGLFEGESFALGDDRAPGQLSGDGPASAVRPPPVGQSVVRQAADEYGQVNLDTGTGGVDVDGDEMEFGGIPQAESERPKGATSGRDIDGALAAEPVVAPIEPPRPRGAKADGTSEKKKTRTSVKIAVAAAALLVVGGSALALRPDIGPFGIYAAQDLFLRGEHQALQTRLSQAVEDARSKDSYVASVAAVTAMQQAQLGAKRFVPLKADVAAQQLSLALRFGGPTSLQSSGQVLLEELKASDEDRSEYRRAHAVKQVLDRNASAPGELAALPRDLFALTVEGEYWLRLDDAPRAVTSWMEAVNQKRCAWTLFGLSRAYLSGNQLQNALDASNQVLELNPEHVGAKLLRADAALRSGELESQTLGVIEDVLQKAELASPSELALAHTLSGEFEFAHGRTAKAAEAFEKALAVEPGNVRALVSSAYSLFAAGRHAAALARFQSAVTAAPDSIAPKVGVVRAQLAMEQLDQAVVQVQALRQALPEDIEVALLGGLVAIAAGDLEIGRKTLQEAVERSRQTPPSRLSHRQFQAVAVEAFVALAASFTKAGEPARAEPILAAAAEQLPGSAALRLAMGDVALGQGQFDKASAEYAAARQLAPNDTAAAFKEGQALSRLKLFREATSAFDRVAETDPNYPGLPLERGLILDKSGKAVEALAQYEQALQADAADLDIQLRVGCGRVDAGQGPNAAALLKDVLVKRPRSAEANYCLGRAMFAEGNSVEALRLLRSAVEFDANSAVYRLHLGWVASDMGQVAVARRELNRSLELDQGLVDAYWQRGVLNLKQGAARDAMVDFRKALELNPAHVAANADMAQALSQLGKENDALPYWEKALAGEPNNATWLFRYGRVLIGRHQGEKGTELLLKALRVVEGQSPTPNWVWQAHYLAALGLAGSSAAVPHWRRYLEMSPHDSPYRGEAKRALAKAGQPWEGQ